MKKFGINLLAVFVILVLVMPAWASNFDAYNKTGIKHSFSQHEDDLFWEGGAVNFLETGHTSYDRNDSTSFPKYKVHYVKWTPVNANGHVIIYNNGLQSHAGWFYETAEKLSQSGYTVYAFDRIGSGRSGDGISIVPAHLSADGMAYMQKGSGHIAHWKVYTKSIHLMKQIAKTQNPGKSINIWANSFAAHILTAYILQYEPADVASYIYTSPGFFSKLPLPFTIPALIAAAPGTYFPTTIPEINGDKGAHLFTSIPHYVRLIARDSKSQRQFTKEFYSNVPELQTYHFSKSAVPGSFLTKTRRFYLIVDGDPMMDTIRTLGYVQQYSQLAAAKRYPGGADHRHFLEFTEDAELALLDIDAFIHGQNIIGNEIGQ